jgi:hypothetical protein
MTQAPIGPDRALSHAARGQALVAAGKDEAALESLEHTARLALDAPRIPWPLANTRWHLNRGIEAAYAYERGFGILSRFTALSLADALPALGPVRWDACRLALGL